MKQKFRLAVICASNQNRSMAAHRALCEKGYDVKSFGTGSAVRLPGPSIDKPNVYSFGTPYSQILNDLSNQDPELYKRLGLTKMLERNASLKSSPEKFQESYEEFEVLITCEERCFDAVCEEILLRGGERHSPVHVINIEIRDNHEDAEIGAKHILELVDLLNNTNDFEDEISRLINDFTTKTRCNILHSVLFY